MNCQLDHATLKAEGDQECPECGADLSASPCSPCEFCEDEKKWAAHYKEERDLWIERFRKAVEVHAGTLHCREDCNCSNRKTLRELGSFLPENVRGRTAQNPRSEA